MTEEAVEVTTGDGERSKEKLVNLAHTPVKAPHPKKQKKGSGQNLQDESMFERIMEAVAALTEKVDMQTTKMDEQTALLKKFDERIDANSEAIKRNKEVLEHLEKRVAELQGDNKRLREAVAEHARYKRRWNLRLNGLAEKDGEDIRETVIGILTRVVPIGADRLREAVDTVHRLGRKGSAATSNNTPRSIILQFVSRVVRDDVWKRSREARVCKEMHIHFKEDFSKEDREARAKLWPSRARWIEEGEKNTTYFFNLEKQRQLKKQINKLSVNNFVYEDQREINKEIHTFYSNLYKSYHSEADCEILFESIEGLNQNIDLEFKHFMENDLDIEEMDAAVLKMSSGKSPGLDGLTAEFYKFFWTDIRRLLHEAFLECISAGSLSNTMRQGLITLIPKPNKNTLYLDNWRPITLLCNDYKILAHVFAERLNRGLKDLVDECQSAFIKGRNIHNHIRLVVDLLDYCDFVDPDSLILFLDFYKAFDTLEHSFLIKALKFLGFGDKFCNIIKMFYNDIYSSVSLNPGITPRFVIKRGIRQGCPISPKLFILATQLLTILIKHSHDIQGISIFEKQYKISQFADDTALLLKDDAEVVKALNRIQLFSKASGLKLNISKCEILPVHSCQHQTIEAIRVVHEVKYLGVLLSKNTLRREEVNITNRLFDMKKTRSITTIAPRHVSQRALLQITGQSPCPFDQGLTTRPMIGQ
uniref:Reverse transcriptase domain-containing protein n=1 Tax=Oryzias latipes TaxID=8090 RepID=A0A3P9JJZ9_ORYLA